MLDTVHPLTHIHTSPDLCSSQPALDVWPQESYTYQPHTLLSTHLARLKVPLFLKGLGGVGDHARQERPLIVLLGGPQQLQARLEQLEEVLQHTWTHLCYVVNV